MAVYLDTTGSFPPCGGCFRSRLRWITEMEVKRISGARAKPARTPDAARVGLTAYRSPRSRVSPHSWIVRVEKRGLAVWK